MTTHDMSTHRTGSDEGEQPAGTEDLLPREGAGEHEPLARDDDRDDYRDDVDRPARMGDGRLEADRMDGDRMDGDRMDGDRMGDDRMGDDRMGDDRMGDDRMDADGMGAGRMDRDRMDGGQWSDEETTAGGDRVMDHEVDGELGDVEPSGLEQPIGAGAVPTSTVGYTDGPTPLFAGSDVDGFRSRWTELQATFVDDPRTAVQQADQLVAEVMQTLAATFARNKQDLEGQWQREGAADTEDLRQALRRYRTFFDQLLRS